MSQDAELVLTQKHRTGGERTLTLLQQRYLRIVRRRRGASVQFTVDILALASGSERYRRLRWSWVVGALLAALVGLVGLVLLAWHPAQSHAVLAGGVLTVLAAVAMGLCVARFVVSIEYRQAYATRYGGVPLVELWVNRPDAGFYRAFVQELERAIAGVDEKVGGMSTDALKAGELRLLRRLAQKGVVGEQVYEAAKAMILMQDTPTA